MGNLVMVEEGERVEVKCRLRDLRDSLRAKRRKVPRVVAEAVPLVVELMNDAVVASSQGVGLLVNPRFSELKGRLASSFTSVVSLKANVSDLNDVRNKAEGEYEDLLRKIRTEPKTLKNCSIGE